jgi:hypothetical protein
MRGVLRVGILSTVTSISLLAVVDLRLGATSLDSFGDPTYSGLGDPV